MREEADSRRSVSVVALALALCLLDALAGGAMQGDPEIDTFFSRLMINLPPWLIAVLLLPLVRAGCRRLPLDLTFRAIAAHTVASLAFALLHTALMATYNSFRYYDAMSWLEAYRRSLFFNMVVLTIVYWLYAGGLQLVESKRALRQRDEDALHLRARLAEARLAGLRWQLNPHFLYNVLNTAAMLAREQRSLEAVAVLARLGELLRYVLRESGSGESELREEIEFLSRYLELERVRFADRLHVQFDVDPALEGVKVPSLLLQPLVENAVRHGISQRPGDGHISIRVHRSGSSVKLEVHDDGPGAPGLMEGGGLGVRNTRDRLKTRYGSAARLTIGSAPGGGTVAVVTLPCEGAA